MSLNVDELRGLFPGLRETTYLNTATMAFGAQPAREAYERAVERWSAGRFDWPDAERAGEAARSLFAGMIGAAATEIAIVPAASVGAGVVAANLPEPRPGDNIVVADGEFSSNYFGWLLLKERGYEIRTVSAAADGALDAERYAERADAGTR